MNRQLVVTDRPSFSSPSRSRITPAARVTVGKDLAQIADRARPFCRQIALGLLLFALQLPFTAAAQEKPSEASMAAYADAANFQTNGAIDLAIDAWKKFLAKYPKHSMAADASHFLGVCYMQKETPDYTAAANAFARALKSPKYDLREESLANYGWCVYVSAGEGEQRDAQRLKLSLDAFQRLMKESPKSRFLDRALFYSGEAAYGMGDAKQAVQYYDELLALPDAKDSPLRCDALYARGVAHEELKQFDEAFASFKQLLAGCDREELITDVHMRVGDLQIMQRDYNSAITSFENALKSSELDEDRSYALFRQAFAYVQSDRPAEAAQKYEQLIAEYPSSPFAGAAILASAQSTYRSGDIEEAAKRFEKVLRQNNPGAATEAAHWLARIKISQGQPDEAVKLVREQLQRGVDGDFTMDLRLDLAEALSMKPETVEESMKLFEQAYRGSPDSPLASRALYNAAFSALQINQPEKALELALEFIRRFPQDTLVPDIKFVAAESQLLVGKANDAADTYTHLLKSTSKDNVQRPIWLLRAGSTLNSAQRFDETEKLLQAEINTLTSPAQKAEAKFLLGQALLAGKKSEDASRAFKASYEADPSWARADEALLMSGQAKLAAKDVDSATRVWEQVASKASNARMVEQARYKLAQVASDQQDFAKAIEYYDQILSSKNDTGLIPYALYGKGWASMQLKEFDSALTPLNQMLTEFESHPLRNDALLARGITQRNLGKHEDAQRDLATYLETNPEGTNLGHALYESALIDQKAKAPQQAAKKLERLVSEVPDYPSMDQVLYELGWSLQESGNDAGAIRYFTDLITKYPDTPLVAEAAYFVGQRNYAAEKWQDAADSFRTAALSADDPGLSEKAFYRLGWSLFKQPDYDASEQAFMEMAEKNPDGKLAFDADMMVGECRFKKTDFESAYEAYTSARDRIRKSNDTSKSIRDGAERQVRELVYLHGGQSAAQLEKWDQAIQWYDELRERFPTSNYLPQVFYETGAAYQQKNDSENALKFYQEVADNYRNEIAARARFMMGEIYFADRKFDQAIPEFQRVMYGYGAEKAPDAFKNWQAKSGFEAGRCSELLMQSAKTEASKNKAKQFAVNFYKYVTEKHPDHELAAKSRERLRALN